jgi:hypothetical protein
MHAASTGGGSAHQRRQRSTNDEAAQKIVTSAAMLRYGSGHITDSVQSVLNSMRRNSSVFVPFPVEVHDVQTPAAVIAAPARAEAPNAAVLFEDMD